MWCGMTSVQKRLWLIIELRQDITQLVSMDRGHMEEAGPHGYTDFVSSDFQILSEVVNGKAHGINLAPGEQAAFRPKQKVYHVPLCSRPGQRLIYQEHLRHPSTKFWKSKKSLSKGPIWNHSMCLTRALRGSWELLFFQRCPPMGGTEQAKKDASV